MSDSPFDRLRKGKRPPSKRVPIVMDSRYAERIEDTERRLTVLQMQARALGGTKTDPQLAADIAEAAEALEAAQAVALEHTEWFIAKALPPHQYEALIAAHPPTKEQKAEARKENQVARWNADTYGPALIEACVYLVTPLDEPDDNGETEQHDLLTAQFVKEMFEGGADSQWNQGECVALAAAAQAANQAAPARIESLGNV